MRILFVLTFITTLVTAQPAPTLLKQTRDFAPAEHLLNSEFASLGDPFFLLVLKANPQETDFARILDLIQPDSAKRQLFVVDESIASPERRGGRRVVISFSGTNNGHVLDTNIMISTFLTPDRMPAGPVLEIWGWDNQRGRYNYYKLDDSGTPDRRLAWKFRGNSVDADLLSQTDRQDTCMACHINGGPIMKELLFPWNNWHSTASPATYLSTATPNAWPVAGTNLRATLRGAEDLERSLIPAIRQFNTRRVNASIARRDSDGSLEVDAQGFSRLNDVRRLLRHLFLTTEFNLISARTLSGQHPFAPPPHNGPAQDVRVPSSFFLNAALLTGGGPLGYRGLGIAQANDFATLLQLSPAEYRTLITTSRVQLGGKDGDAHFAWFTPEPSHADNDVVDRLLRRNMLSPAFVAAVLAIDLETPVLSPHRARLLALMPDSFRFTPNTPPVHPDDLTRQVIARLTATPPAPASPEAEFLALLQDADPVQRLRERVIRYRDEQRQRLAANRAQELANVYQRLLVARARVIDDELLRTINETQDRLLPLPFAMRRQQTHFNTEQ